jgi:hypothetical protein
VSILWWWCIEEPKLEPMHGAPASDGVTATIMDETAPAPSGPSVSHECMNTNAPASGVRREISG